MAFTSRSERSPTFAKFGNTPVSVGPGSYGSYFNHEIDHAYAPFSSTSERAIGGKPSERVDVVENCRILYEPSVCVLCFSSSFLVFRRPP
mmetsp:Transcript_19495/g.64610  ORF Transcript_19495/g.64610 Transcript_19495/m.64610 type:complete len:90 (-) Transcript_19495:2061-2330(-)